MSRVAVVGLCALLGACSVVAPLEQVGVGADAYSHKIELARRFEADGRLPDALFVWRGLAAIDPRFDADVVRVQEAIDVRLEELLARRPTSRWCISLTSGVACTSLQPSVPVSSVRVRERQ